MYIPSPSVLLLSLFQSTSGLDVVTVTFVNHRRQGDTRTGRASSAADLVQRQGRRW